LIPQPPGRSDDVEQAVAVEVLDDAAAGEADLVDAGVHGDVGEPLDVVLGLQHGWRDQPLPGNLVRILADRHVGNVQQPGGSEILRLRLEPAGEGVDRAACASLERVSGAAIDRKNTRRCAMVQHAVFLLAEAQCRQTDGTVEPRRFLRFLIWRHARSRQGGEQWAERLELLQRLLAEPGLEQLRGQPHANRKILDRIAGVVDHASQDGDQVRLVRAKHHRRCLFEPDSVGRIGDVGQALRHRDAAGSARLGCRLRCSPRPTPGDDGGHR
jgi:hypothetical protein